MKGMMKKGMMKKGSMMGGVMKGSHGNPEDKMVMYPPYDSTGPMKKGGGHMKGGMMKKGKMK